MWAIHYHLSHFISLPVSSGAHRRVRVSSCELRLKANAPAARFWRGPLHLHHSWGSLSSTSGGSEVLCHPWVWHHHHQAQGFRGLTSELPLSAETSGAGCVASFWGAPVPN